MLSDPGPVVLPVPAYHPQLDDPTQVALETGRVLASPGHIYHPGLPGHLRLNIATSPARRRKWCDVWHMRLDPA